MEPAKEPAAAAEGEQKLPPGAGYDADDEELFEIDLEGFHWMPPPSNQVFELDLEALDRLHPAAKGCEQQQWSSGHQQGALLANCILPIAYICNAIPMDAAAAAMTVEHKVVELWDLPRMVIHG